MVAKKNFNFILVAKEKQTKWTWADVRLIFYIFPKYVFKVRFCCSSTIYSMSQIEKSNLTCAWKMRYYVRYVHTFSKCVKISSPIVTYTHRNVGQFQNVQDSIIFQGEKLGNKYIPVKLGTYLNSNSKLVWAKNIFVPHSCFYL